MKKIINGGSAVSLFVASFLVLAGTMPSCNDSKPTGPTVTSTTATATATPNCPTCVPVNFSIDTTGPNGGPKIILVGKTKEAIPAGTDIKLEVVLPAVSTKAGN